MIAYEDGCVGCLPEMGCIGNTCPHRNIRVLYCDECDNQCDELYVFEGHELCEDCLLEQFDKII